MKFQPMNCYALYLISLALSGLIYAAIFAPTPLNIFAILIIPFPIFGLAEMVMVWRHEK